MADFSRSPKGHFYILIASAIWLFLIAGGFYFLLKYSSTPGEVGFSDSNWPARSTILRNSQGFTLVLFTHPKCACTRATMAELERLLAAVKNRPLEVEILVFRSANEKDFKDVDGLSQRFSVSKNVRVISDSDGAQAQLFGALTSGQTFLYDKEAHLLFKGGITPARGHEGDSVGRDSITSWVLQGVAGNKESSVFGCSLKHQVRNG